MKLSEAKAQFISSWGAFGTHWGINRTMAQIHALLLISPEPITAGRYYGTAKHQPWKCKYEYP